MLLFYLWRISFVLFPPLLSAPGHCPGAVPWFPPCFQPDGSHAAHASRWCQDTERPQFEPPHAALAAADPLRRCTARPWPTRHTTAGQAPHHHARDPRKGASRRPPNSLLELRPRSSRPCHRSPQWPSAPDRVDQQSPHQTLSPHRPLPARAAAPTFRTSAPSPTSTAPKSLQRTTATPKTGSFPANPASATIPSSRTPPRSGTTTTPWGLTA